MSERRGTFVDRVLDGAVRIDQLEDEVVAWTAGDRRRPLHEVLGLDADELELIAATPDALRYVLHARRFGRSFTSDDLRGQHRVRAHASRLNAAVIDPFDLAAIESLADLLDEREPSHA